MRVNQVGYVQDRAKQAFLLSTEDHEGESFDLVGDGDVVVFSGTIGADRGPWNSRFGHVNQIDFDAFADPGVFVLKAAGATSPPFRVGTGSDLYTPLLHNALFYFLAQRDGADVDPTVLEREPSHLNDAHARVYETPEYHNGFLVHDLVPTGDRTDVEGGWFDAGDYVKFAHTTAFVLAVMGEALRDHPELFAGDGPDFASEAKFGLDWLLRQWDGKRKILYYQVSMGNTGLGYLSDHDVWRLPEVDDALKGRAYRYLAHRPVFRVGPPGTLVPPSIAGRMAAAFGLCFQIFRRRMRGSPTAACAQGRACSTSRRPSTRRTTPRRRAATTRRGRCGATTWSSGRSSCIWRSATRRVRARRSAPHGRGFYLESAAEWADAYMNQSDDQHDVFNLYDVAGLAHPELYEAIVAAGDPPLAVTADEVLANMQDQLDTAAALEEGDPFGFGWITATRRRTRSGWWRRPPGTTRSPGPTGTPRSWTPRWGGRSARTLGARRS